VLGFLSVSTTGPVCNPVLNASVSFNPVLGFLSFSTSRPTEIANPVLGFLSVSTAKTSLEQFSIPCWVF